MFLKAAAIAILLMIFVAFLALITFELYRIQPLGAALIVSFFCLLIIVSVSILIHKINQLNKKLDLLLKKANITQEHIDNRHML